VLFRSRITTEVEAATFTGAKEQIYAKHGNVQQIVNLRQVSGIGSSTDMGSLGSSFIGILGLLALVFLIEYWHFILMGVAGLLILAIIYYFFCRDT
jgi:hypothetical protein